MIDLLATRLLADTSVLQIPEVRVVIAVAATLAAVAILAYGVTWLRERFLGNEQTSTGTEHLEVFRDLAQAGTIGDDEYRRVRSAIAARLQENLSSPRSATGLEVQVDDREGQDGLSTSESAVQADDEDRRE